MSRKRVPLNQNECTANFRIGVPFEQNLQSWVFKCITENSISVSGAMADAMKKHSEDGKLTELAVQLILCEEKKDTGKVTLSANKISRYFPKEYSKQQIEQVIFELLEDWKKNH